MADVFLICSYLAVFIPFNQYLKDRPVAVKLGMLPEGEALKLVCGDQRELVAQYAVTKVLFYFGTLVENWSNRVKIPAEYYNMFRTIETAVKLDPYNMDAYYFVQAAFTWEIGRIRDVNKVLIYGMKFRTRDYTLPFYVGFNYAYFLKDYKDAAPYMKRAAELSGNPLYTTLAARYFYEAGQNDLGILFLDDMASESKNREIKKVYELRKHALTAVRYLQKGVARFRAKQGRLPADLAELVSAGIISKIPTDPYGGRFYLDSEGKVETTSKFAFGRGKK